MENVIYKEVTLPDHEKATGTRVCHVCHGTMNPCTHEKTFNLPHQNAKVKVSGIQVHKCEECGEMIYSSAEVKLIEAEIQKALSQEGKV